jgi:glycyl-tRNA synthetase
MGIPFAITVDFDSLKDKAVTIRERDSMKQVRKPIDEVVNMIGNYDVYFME